MLDLLMLVEIEPYDLLRANESHPLIAILLVLLAILLLHLANLGVLASLDVSLPHHRVVVVLSSLFATLCGFDLGLLLLLLISLCGLFVFNWLHVLAVLLIVKVTLSFANLHNCDPLVIIEFTYCRR